jgi:predicted CoA-substrate-specific enzyme activase
MTINAGIDIGSVTTKCVIVKDKEIIAKELTRTGANTEEAAELVFNRALKSADKSEPDIDNIISTGYGRRLFKKANKIITEISAAGKGAYNLAGNKSCLVIDVGGQDTKVIEVNGGEVTDFLMNDKCAAGTGRFLEMMAHVLETDFQNFSELAMKFDNPVEINSTCSVFAESEVISLLSKAAKKENIAAGLFKAIAARIASMLGQFGKGHDIVFCGGGAKSQALKYFLEESIGSKVFVLDNPQFVVAFGAAILFN